MAKKKVRKKATTKVNATKERVEIMKLASSHPYFQEWHIAVIGLKGFSNLVRLIIPIINDQAPVQTPQGVKIQMIKKAGQAEYYADDHFTDHTFSINKSAYSYSRELKPEEQIYKTYTGILAERKKIQAKRKADLEIAKINAEQAAKTKTDKKETSQSVEH